MQVLNITNPEGDGVSVQLYDAAKRSKILILEEKRIRPAGYSDEKYLRWLNHRYVDAFGVEFPHHYMINRDGIIFSVKPDYIKTSIPKLSAYSDDIFIMVDGFINNIRPQQTPSIVKLCTMLYKKYGITPLNVMFYPNDNRRGYVRTNSQRTTVSSLVQAVETMNPLYVVEHSVLTGSKDLHFMYPTRPLKIKQLSETGGVTKQAIQDLNNAAHGEVLSRIVPGKVAVFPKEHKAYAPRKSHEFVKKSEFLYKQSKGIFSFE